MPELSTPADDSAVVTPPAPDAADNGTDPKVDNPDASKSDDTTVVTDDDKSKETKTTDKPDDAPASTQLDSDLDDWIEKRGLPKATDDAQKQKYQDLRNEQREFTKSQQAKREAADAKALSDEMAKSKPQGDEEDDDLRSDEEKRLDKIEEDFAAERTTRIQSEFYNDNKVTDEEHKTLLDIYKENVTTPATEEGKRRAFEYWSSPDALPQLLALAKAKLAANVDTSAIEDEAARKERERIARESNAKSPNGAAKSTTTSDNPDINSDEARAKRFRERYGK